MNRLSYVYVVASVIMIALLSLSFCGADAHEMKAMGKRTVAGGMNWLYGMNRMDDALTVINCCREGGDGDCQLFPEEGVSYVKGGYLLKSGEFIPEREATVSPDENFYVCKHSYATKSHCFFAPAKGF
jgi:hypothetical protein